MTGLGCSLTPRTATQGYVGAVHPYNFRCTSYHIGVLENFLRTLGWSAIGTKPCRRCSSEIGKLQVPCILALATLARHGSLRISPCKFTKRQGTLKKGTVFYDQRFAKPKFLTELDSLGQNFGFQGLSRISSPPFYDSMKRGTVTILLHGY